MKTINKIGIGFYILMFIVVFGHSFNVDYKKSAAYWDDPNTVPSIAKGIFWPMYVSIKVFENLRKSECQ
jgi:hypothetical protein